MTNPTTGSFTIQMLQQADLSPELAEALNLLDHAAFSAPQEADPNQPAQPASSQEPPIEWAGCTLQFLGFLDGKLVSKVGILPHTITVGGQPVRIAGIGSVATYPEFQRRGFAAQLMSAAGAYIQANPDYDFGMLFCSEKRSLYYAKFGWLRIHNPLFILQKEGRRVFRVPAMVLPRAGKNWPEGEVNTCGLPW
jgi:GNAT superfamily N-acetyltransferase